MRTGKNANDGSFTVFYRNGWAYLTVQPPAESGRPVYREEVENRMKLLEVPPVRGRTIEALIEAARGIPEPLVEWPAGRHLAAVITVHVSDDEMSAWVTVHPPKKGGAPPTPADIERQLASAGVVSGVDHNAVRNLLGGSRYGVPLLLAAGTAPINGSSRRIKYHFNTTRGKPYLEMEFGRINLKELNFIEHCKQGDLLAELLPPVAPVDGRTVLGRALPAQATTRSVSLSAGPNTRFNPDRTQLYAACDGNARLDERRQVVVEPVVKVKNVNYETGNIYFNGSVIVEGHIADGFVVQAGGDIQVGRGVGKARLQAGRSVLLKTGMNGNGEGTLQCAGDLFARYLESCSVTCRGNAFVEEAIMQSEVTVRKHCVLSGRRSEIIAGSLIVGGSLWCRKLGNFNEANTRIALGVPPEVLLEYRAAKGSLEDKYEQLNQSEEQLHKLERAMSDGHDDERVRQAARELEESLPQLSAEINELRHKVPQLRDQLQAARESMLVVEDTIFPGTVISFARQEYHVPDKGARKTILRVGERGLIESGFDIRNKPTLTFEPPEPSEASKPPTAPEPPKGPPAG